MTLMIDTLTHFYRRGTQPFRSLSGLPEAEALRIMQDLYVEGSAIWERFKDPLDYLQSRRQTEAWLHQAFIAKGGKPAMDYPIYFVIGSPKWMQRVADPLTLATTAEIKVPFSIFKETEISFTYPDSMVSLYMESIKDPACYQPEYHGKLFTQSEILAIVAKKGLPDQGWETKVPDRLAHYIEAQAWTRAPLTEWLQTRIAG
jgi:hypothetical protein